MKSSNCIVSLHMQGHEVMERETSKFTDDIFKIRDKFVTDGMIVICLR